ncbi:MAG: type II CAAX endopeptidase family protein [Ignavibacteriaceae bacterium]
MEIATKKSNFNKYDHIASIKHTVIMLLILISFSISGLISNTSSDNTISSNFKIILYSATAVGEWALLYYMWIGIKKTKKISLKNLIAGKYNVEFGLNDILKGFAFWIIAGIILYLVKYLLGLPLISNTNHNLLPQNYLEYTLFFILSLSAGFCEEIIYRGYFQKQFSSIFKNKWIAILLQGFLFGFSHGYQGIKYMVLISVFGVLLGLLAAYVKNLKPGMIAHSWENIFSGIILQGW